MRLFKYDLMKNEDVEIPNYSFDENRVQNNFILSQIHGNKEIKTE